MLERGALGVWLVGEGGRAARAPGGRRVHCWCVHVEDRSLPSADRIAHLLLALRTDEQGFATVANLAFSGAPRRVRRRLPPAQRPALDAARAHSTACRTARAAIPDSGPCRIGCEADHALMSHTPASPQVRRIVLVPAASPGRGDELVRRYRLARLRLAGREASCRRLPPARS